MVWLAGETLNNNTLRGCITQARGFILIEYVRHLTSSGARALELTMPHLNRETGERQAEGGDRNVREKQWIYLLRSDSLRHMGWRS